MNKDLIKEVFGKADPIIVDLDTNKKQSYLQENISYLHYRILEMGIVNNGLIRYLAHGPVRSSIFSLICSYPRQLAAKCEASGFMVRPIVSPTVPKGKERLRICIHAGNTKKEIDTLLNVIATWVYSFDEKKRPIGCRI